ncbi:menaquinone biosynthesis protein [bacterium]|nr:menaquinone biosynthesis protein [bacterium]
MPSDQLATIKISAVSYLNTKPIVYGLENGRLPHRFDIRYDIPSECAKQLAGRTVDLALIPSIEYSRIRETISLFIVPSIAVISRGEVRSVELFFNRGLEQIRTVAVDSSSRTSVALLRIILGEKFDIQPELIEMEPDLSHMLSKADAALVIGDKALHYYNAADNRLDLGEEWNDLTDGLPFVYSFWAGVPDRLHPTDIKTLIDSRDLGLAHIKEISDIYQQASVSGLSTEFYEKYLTENIRYEFGKDEIEGLKEYLSYCFYYGLIGEIPEITFYNME